MKDYLNEIAYEAMLEYESICENLLIKNFSDNEEIMYKIQISILDKAQEIFEEKYLTI